MKKRVVCLLMAVLVVLPMMLTACGGDEEVVPSAATTGPMTITLYGITGESTTEEAIKLVEEKLNVYTEGQYNTHLVLKLYTEDEYYDVIEEKLAALALQAEADKKKPSSATTAVTESTPDEDDGEESKYPEEKENQLDIFMVQGTAKMYDYMNRGDIVSMKEALGTSSRARILRKYIPGQLLAMTTLEGVPTQEGIVEGGDTYGIPNTSVYGEYTYLLVNKELASQYYYSADDVSTLATLGNFLDDVKTNHSDYIPLYNLPDANAEYFSPELSLFGSAILNQTYLYSKFVPKNLLSVSSFTNYLQNSYEYRKAGYVTEGDMHKLPEGQKVAAAFLKGNAALPEAYEDDYYVIPYAKPLATAEDCPGTMFCISKYAKNLNRCMEIITAIQTVSDFRNTFQYGVENVHYTVDEYTGIVSYLNDDYSMDPADTGSLLLLKPNSTMSPEMLKLAENDWALAKQQNLDTLYSPYILFGSEHLTYITEENYAEKSENKVTSKYMYEYTQDILDNLKLISDDYMKQIEEFEEYVDDDGKTVDFATFIKKLSKKLDAEIWYRRFKDTSNADSPVSQYSAWYEINGPKK